MVLKYILKLKNDYIDKRVLVTYIVYHSTASCLYSLLNIFHYLHSVIMNDLLCSFLDRSHLRCTVIQLVHIDSNCDVYVAYSMLVLELIESFQLCDLSDVRDLKRRKLSHLLSNNFCCHLSGFLQLNCLNMP